MGIGKPEIIVTCACFGRTGAVGLLFGDMVFEELAESKTFWKLPDGVHGDVFWGGMGTSIAVNIMAYEVSNFFTYYHSVSNGLCLTL